MNELDRLYGHENLFEFFDLNNTYHEMKKNKMIILIIIVVIYNM